MSAPGARGRPRAGVAGNPSSDALHGRALYALRSPRRIPTRRSGAGAPIIVTPLRKDHWGRASRQGASVEASAKLGMRPAQVLRYNPMSPTTSAAQQRGLTWHDVLSRFGIRSRARRGRMSAGRSRSCTTRPKAARPKARSAPSRRTSRIRTSRSMRRASFSTSTRPRARARCATRPAACRPIATPPCRSNWSASRICPRTRAR